ncbi:helix-turn-helix domain-containing protein [Marinomonas sp. M1K-6]|uniref:Helix-turn-helix domain-containing protein n=1 Tax=Marinomonas profundi TaxID=2726122 RepID=A0A847QZ42_9GAMM|nr:helix-turn-helix transcriptional regulator [Marinomonas profundi]NLQ16211.1 helix-turn-helix domain-containing protein [Marinomonas profundi]UDV03209.1 helix-turn-helix domain-containing protein [Marinomonas profundi]
MNKLILNTLGRNLQNLRLAKGLSLSQLAQNAGIAKSNLSRIEQGDGNPTLETIWRLAMQLKVPFGDLVASIQSPLGENGVQVKLIDQGNDNPRVDVYWMSCAPHTIKRSDAHFTGTTESITLISGAIQAGENDNLHDLALGASLTFSADKPHSYRTGDLWATLIMIITYPKQETPT